MNGKAGRQDRLTRHHFPAIMQCFCYLTSALLFQAKKKNLPSLTVVTPEPQIMDHWYHLNLLVTRRKKIIIYQISRSIHPVPFQLDLKEHIQEGNLDFLSSHQYFPSHNQTFLENLQRQTPRRRPNQMSKSPKLTPHHAKEQQLYF